MKRHRQRGNGLKGSRGGTRRKGNCGKAHKVYGQGSRPGHGPRNGGHELMPGKEDPKRARQAEETRRHDREIADVARKSALAAAQSL